MADVVGIWSFNGNGWSGSLRINSVLDVQGTLEVGVNFDEQPGRADPWTGVWDAAAGHIVLNRTMPGNLTQTYDGFLGDHHPNDLILAGSFTQSNVGAPRTRFGWFANNRQNIIN